MGSSSYELSHRLDRMTQPLCSTTFQPLHRYYELLRPCATHWYSSPSEGHSFGFLPSHRGDRFPRSPREPEMGSRCLHAGHRPVRKQVTPGLVPSQQRCSVLMSGVLLFDASSAVHLRSSSHPTLDTSRVPFRRRSPPGLFTPAARRSLESDPAARFREAILSSPVEHHLSVFVAHRCRSNLPPSP